MDDHPIQGLMTTAMENLKDMVEANTIIGNPIQAPEGSIIIPVSKVGFGFAAGGSEFQSTSNSSPDSEATLPFGGGSGGGVSITPVAFLIVSEQGIKMVHLDQQTHIYEKMLDFAPQVVEKVQEIIKSSDKKQSPKKDTEKKIKQAPTQYDV
ncbi:MULTISPECIES: GerW family sporulation protein [Clostridia]|uniref:GerW family sporulation protein n=1 Tax=Clostridia TaxID=186801 RepID=UPI000EA24EF8|nr:MULTISPECIES: GerW family sporulation protein [Clostridia]NBJ69015.1 sporulation protein YtfJ [Roseburia sp. 1XD42-34]RKI79916.1 sporulation protein YtfJ [Clostridium sp. 1xD42-85]